LGNDLSLRFTIANEFGFDQCNVALGVDKEKVYVLPCDRQFRHDWFERFKRWLYLSGGKQTGESV
jgi:hypothetical protein